MLNLSVRQPESLEELFAALKDCKAARKLLLVDACRNDPQSELSRSREQVKLESATRPPATEAVPKGVMALFCCDAGQKAFEHPELNHGIFFHHVIEGWKGAAGTGGKVSLDDLRKH